jgi:hypothetical protein
MSVVNNNLLLAAEEEGGYRIERSVRLRRNVPTYFSRTPASAGNRRTWTWSAWIKRGHLGAATSTVFDTNSSMGGVRGGIKFISDSFYINQNQTGGSATAELRTTALFRDPSAWYHFVFVWDTTQATASNRMKMYVNGVQITSFTTALYPNQNTDSALNGTSLHKIGADGPDLTDECFDGYLTEINFVDGQALTPSSFGEFNEDTGVWQPKAYAGTYGTNGFYLNFKNNASTSALGTDYSGNGNNWTTNNISLSAGATYDSMIDVPTPYDDGGNGRGNYCVLNPLNQQSGVSISNGNLSISTGNTPVGGANGTIGVSSGKWYWEVTSDSSNGVALIGIRNQSAPITQYPGFNTNGYAYWQNGQKITNDSASSYGSSWTTGDVIGVAFDADSGSITFYKNNVSQGVAFTSIPMTNTWFPAHGDSTAGNQTADNYNFGQRPFAYTPPTGFKALNTQNLPEPTIVDGGEYFNTVLWSGNSASPRSITGVGFSPDLVWAKGRTSGSLWNVWFDSIRGGGQLSSNQTDAELSVGSNVAGYVSSYDADGFTVTAGNSSIASLNLTGQTYVAWNWRGSDSAPVTNTAGSITSTVSANPTAGFSIVTWTDVGNSANTVGHGLNQVPKVVIWKARGTTSAWIVNADIDGTRYGLQLESTIASSAGNLFPAPTSTVIQTWALNTTMVAYCFSEVAGYSRFGRYTGNGSADGPFVFCGFRPRWVMFKRTDSTSDWVIYDTARETFNVMGTSLYANLSSAEISSPPRIDMLSNGFKLRTTGEPNWSSSTVIFAAFAEHPFQLSLAR